MLAGPALQNSVKVQAFVRIREVIIIYTELREDLSRVEVPAAGGFGFRSVFKVQLPRPAVGHYFEMILLPERRFLPVQDLKCLGLCDRAGSFAHSLVGAVDLRVEGDDSDVLMGVAVNWSSRSLCCEGALEPHLAIQDFDRRWCIELEHWAKSCGWPSLL